MFLPAVNLKITC